MREGLTLDRILQKEGKYWVVIGEDKEYGKGKFKFTEEQLPQLVIDLNIQLYSISPTKYILCGLNGYIVSGMLGK